MMEIKDQALRQKAKIHKIGAVITRILGLFSVVSIVCLFLLVRQIHINTVLNFPPHLNNLKPRILILS